MVYMGRALNPKRSLNPKPMFYLLKEDYGDLGFWGFGAEVYSGFAVVMTLDPKP